MNWGISLDIVPDMLILIKMNKELAELFAYLDFKYDIEIEKYFQLPEQERNDLATMVANALFENTDKLPIQIHNMIVTIHAAIRDAEEKEQYERADIFKNIEKYLWNRIER